MTPQPPFIETPDHQLQEKLAEAVLQTPAAAHAIAALLQLGQSDGFKGLDADTLTELARLVAPFARQPTVGTFLLTADTASYRDARPAVNRRWACNFTLTLPGAVRLDDALVRLLGQEDAQHLMIDWGKRIDFGQRLAGSCKVALFHDFYVNGERSESGDISTPAADLAGAGLSLADDAEATLVCAVLLQKSVMVGGEPSEPQSDVGSDKPGRLSTQETRLLSSLRNGAVMSASGTLYLDSFGSLRARNLTASMAHSIPHWLLAKV